MNKFMQLPHGAYRSDRPRNMVDLEFFWQQGIRTIISFQTGAYKEIDQIDGEWFDEKAAWESLGGEWIHEPCSNFLPPSYSQTVRVMAIIASRLKYGKVLFHCLSGVDRTGWFAALIVGLYNIKHFPNAGNRKILADAWKTEAWEKGTHFWFFWWKPFFLSVASRI